MMKGERALTEQIGIVERKLEIRRERAVRHLRQARAEIESGIQSGMKWVPLAMVGAIGATAFAVGRRRRANGASTPLHHTNGGGPGVNGTGARTLAIVVALAGMVVRVALAPEVRELWSGRHSSRRPSSHHRDPTP
jgi:hypothetical protein